MQGRKLDVSLNASSLDVAELRGKFDAHVDECTDCQPALCFQAQTLWRNVCLGALRVHGTGA